MSTLNPHHCTFFPRAIGLMFAALAVFVSSAQAAGPAKATNIQLAGPAIAGLPYCTFINLTNATLTDVNLKLIDIEGAYVLNQKTVDVASGEGTSLSVASDVTQYCTVSYFGRAGDGRATHCTLDSSTYANETCVPVN